MQAQELTVKRMMMQMNDLSASQYRRDDINGQACALVKVQLAVANVVFEGNIIMPVEYKGGEYWVYMSHESRELRIKHQSDIPSFVPLHVRFEDYGINSVQSLKTYNLTLLMPQVLSAGAEAGSRYFRLTVSPGNSNVTVDGIKQLVDENGLVFVPLLPGTHYYQVEAEGYATKSGQVVISDKSVEERVVLESSLVTVTVSCPTAGVQIYVDDRLLGGSPWKGQITVGAHRLEARLAGYRSQIISETITQSSNKKITIPALQQTTGSLDVDYKPQNAEVWIDGRKAGRSPDVFPNLSAGSHAVEIRASGYETKTENVMIADGQRIRLFGTLNLSKSSMQNINQEQVRRDIFFDANKHQIKSTERTKLNDIAEYFKKYPKSKIVLTGYTDAITDDKVKDTNLSKARVLEVQNELIQQWGLKKDCIVVNWKGSSIAPFVANEFNRLVIIYLYIDSENIPNSKATINVDNIRKNVEKHDLNIETFTVNDISFNMIRVEGGTFHMGDTSEQMVGERVDNGARPVHQVTLSSYYIGETEVTQELWETVMGENPSNLKGNKHPVENVSWNDCQDFVKELNKRTGKQFRLPTEAEWEFAARGGNKSRGYSYAGSNSLDIVAWYKGTFFLGTEGTRDVKTKQANELGLYDMSGNVWEWCQDWYGSYSSNSHTNPTGPSSGSYRVWRGGSWHLDAKFCRVSVRNHSEPDYRAFYLGLRLVLQ